MSTEFKLSKKFQHHLAMFEMVDALASISDGKTSIGMTTAYYGSLILVYLSMYGEQQKAVIRNHFGLSEQVITRAILTLDKGVNWKKSDWVGKVYAKPALGLVQARENPEHRTEVLVSLTPEGEEFLKKYVK